jgi:hypothetical protein
VRSGYVPYWLVLWDNEHGVEHPNLDQLEALVRRELERIVRRKGLPASLTAVWLFDENDPIPRRLEIAEFISKVRTVS